MTSRPPRRRNVAGKLILNLAVCAMVACGAASSPKPSTPGGEQRPDSLEQVAPPAAEAPAPEAAPPPPPPAAPAPQANEPVEARDRERTEAAAVSATPHDDLQTAQADLERARVELNQALAAPNAHAPKSSSAGGAAASRGAADEAPAKAEKKSEGSSCSTACRAFSSLERAATAVCRITGEKDGRCSHAHAVLADAKKRVAVCPCTSE